ncbi:MAG: PilN domain-containing protein [Planctomycetota bacterium]
MITVNLLPESVRAARRERRRVRRWIHAAAAYAGAWVLAVAVANEMVTDPAAGLEPKLAAVNASLTSAEASIELIHAEQQRLLGRVRVVRDIAGQPDWSVLVALLADRAGDSVGLREIRLELDGDGRSGVSPSDIAFGPYAVEIIGIASSQAEATAFVLDLERSGLFALIDIAETSPERVGQQPVVRFRLLARIGEEATP